MKTKSKKSKRKTVLTRKKYPAGTKLEHRHEGRVVARATYVAAGVWRVAGRAYKSASGAARAAAEALGLGGNYGPGFWAPAAARGVKEVRKQEAAHEAPAVH